MKVIKPKAAPKRQKFFSAPVLLAVILAALFWKSFLPNYVHFSNDGPLGQQNVDWAKLPAAMTGVWVDLNDMGYGAGTFSPTVSALFKWIVGPVGYAKFYAPFALMIVGLGAWTFFRALKFTPAAALLGALAATLNSTYFGNACWGVASGEIALGFNFLALALVIVNTPETPRVIRWTRLALAGLCVGINIMEAVDIGALYSMLIAAFVFYKSLTETQGNPVAKISRSIGRVAVIAIFAAFLATQTITALVGTFVQGVSGTAQDTETKAQHWDWATQWSLPKKETLGLVVPGLFGYKMDTPQGMMPAFINAFQGGVYWGGIGRDPANDRFFDSGGQGTPPSSWMRQTGGGNYCGILIALVATWAIAQSFRRQNSVFTGAQKKFIWFWAAVLAVSLPLAWGRFAPFSKTSDSPMFYALLYHLPYFSTIRSPAKFLIFVCWAIVILFGCGMHALNRRQLEGAAVNAGPVAQFKSWWTRAGGFDRKWIFISSGIFCASVFGWLIYSGQKNGLVHYLQKMGFTDENFAQTIAAFSIGQVSWFIFLFAIALALLALFVAGYFSGLRTKLGIILVGGFILFDLGRADLPYIIHWDYKQKYDIAAATPKDSINPIINLLRDKPYEHRVAGLPFDAQLHNYNNYFGGMGIYRIEWTQHHFPYYNIQCLDLIQMSRMAEDLKMYLEAFSPHSVAEYTLVTRHWELTNTRYLLGAAGFLDVLNQQFDPVQHRFRIAQRFDIISKPGIIQPTKLEELTATMNADGELALIEFTGALPRARLYSNWQVNPNDDATLKTLASTNFDPWQTVLVSMPLPVAAATNQNAGSVEFKSYAPKDILFNAQATGPAVLLLNDKFDPHWRVLVDGKPAELLRCNFIMRGVYLTPGAHLVEFKFTLPNDPLYVSLAAIVVGVLLCGFLIFLERRQPAPTS
jgi:hypothetical protein